MKLQKSWQGDEIKARNRISLKMKNWQIKCKKIIEIKNDGWKKMVKHRHNSKWRQKKPAYKNMSLRQI